MEQDGISKLKIYTESRTTEAAKFLSYAHHDWHISAKSLESFTSLVKMLREAICLLVRITAVMMRALESKTKTDLRQSIGRSLTVMSGQMSTLVATLLKTFESLENGSKNGTKKESIRYAMFFVITSINE